MWKACAFVVSVLLVTEMVMVFQEVECKILYFKMQSPWGRNGIGFEFAFSKLIVLFYSPNLNELPSAH